MALVVTITCATVHASRLSSWLEISESLSNFFVRREMMNGILSMRHLVFYIRGMKILLTCNPLHSSNKW